MRRVLLFVFVVSTSFGQTSDRAHRLAKKAQTVERQLCSHVDDADTCHRTYAEGCSNSEKSTYDPFLSYLKNLTPSPRSARSTSTFDSLEEFQALDTSAKALTGDERKHASDLANLGQGNIHTVIGYLYYAQIGGIETCNCQLKDPAYRDYHLGIGFSKALAEKIAAGDERTSAKKGQATTKAQRTSIVVEMTPYFRTKFDQKWNLPELQDFVGKQVKIVGQLVFDSEHAKTGQDCALGISSATCWRGSAWELHPVIKFFVCTDESNSCSDSSLAWKEIDDLDTEH
jgi:hypothetical protein